MRPSKPGAIVYCWDYEPRYEGNRLGYKIISVDIDELSGSLRGMYRYKLLNLDTLKKEYVRAYHFVEGSYRMDE